MGNAHSCSPFTEGTIAKIFKKKIYIACQQQRGQDLYLRRSPRKNNLLPNVSCELINAGTLGYIFKFEAT